MNNNSRTDQVSMLLSRHILDVWGKELALCLAEDVNKHIRPIFDFEVEKVEQFAKFVAQELKAQWNISLKKETVESISKVVFNFMVVNFKPNDCGIKFKVSAASRQVCAEEASLAISKYLLERYKLEFGSYDTRDVDGHVRPAFEKSFYKVEDFSHEVAQRVLDFFNISLKDVSHVDLSRQILDFIVARFDLNDCGIKFTKSDIEILPSGTDCSIKPPLGIIPKNLWMEARIHELAECLARHKEKPDDKFLEWAKELYELVDDLRFDEKIK